MLERAFGKIKRLKLPPMFKSLFRIKKLVISLGIFVGIIITGIVGSILRPNVDMLTGPVQATPSYDFPLGTDQLGRDLLALLFRGIQGSIFVGGLAAVIGVTIGVTVGVIMGFRGGIIDSVLLLVCDIMMAVPSILVIMLVSMYVPTRSPLIVALFLGGTVWPGIARGIRPVIMSLKTREFLYMSRMAGLREIRIILEDLLLMISSFLLLAFVALLSGAMVGEAGLSMLGLGTNVGTTLGMNLQYALTVDAVRRGMWWWFMPPGLCLVAMTVCLFLTSFSLDEYFNPRLRGG